MDVAFEPLTLQSAMVSLFLFQLASPQQRGPFVCPRGKRFEF